MARMASFDNLPADQRAVLELVLRRGRSYDEIAQLLSIDRAGVRQRALAALDALGPPTRVPAERRALITDYLLGALPASVAAEVREHLRGSASERAWARAVSSEVQGLSESPLPEVPAETGGATPAQPQEAATSEAAGDAGTGPVTHATRSSRRGGALLLGGLGVIVIAVVLILVLTSGSSKPATHPGHTIAASGTTGTTGTTGATGATGARVIAQINLKPPAGGGSPVGIAEVLQVQKQFGVAIAAQGLAANKKSPPNAYAVWLYNSPGDSKILGFVNPAVGKNGQLKTAGGLPTNASHYTKLLVTLETKSNPKTPGTIVLEGTLTGL
jgi:Sigma-70, region 4